ncbi:unnamed protein product, partial [Protopolystoma xenopodis]
KLLFLPDLRRLPVTPAEASPNISSLDVQEHRAKGSGDNSLGDMSDSGSKVVSISRPQSGDSEVEENDRSIYLAPRRQLSEWVFFYLSREESEVNAVMDCMTATLKTLAVRDVIINPKSELNASPQQANANYFASDILQEEVGSSEPRIILIKNKEKVISNSDPGRCTFPDVWPASSVSLAILSTTQQLVKETCKADPLTKRVLNSCGISTSALGYSHFLYPPITPSLLQFFRAYLEIVATLCAILSGIHENPPHLTLAFLPPPLLSCAGNVNQSLPYC